MRITALKCAVIGKNPIVRVVTDEGVSGFAAVESFKPYLRSHLLYYEQLNCVTEVPSSPGEVG